jgi:hypothetical protein
MTKAPSCVTTASFGVIGDQSKRQLLLTSISVSDDHLDRRGQLNTDRFVPFPAGRIVRALLPA